jgi:16S rRNA (guanine527-N7)-methyltransferase
MERQVDEFKKALVAAIASYGLDPLSEEQVGRLVKHYSMIVRWNRRINLTRIIAPEEAARLHYAESLYGGRFMRDVRTILDVGSGAGFPAVPLAVMLTRSRVTALEANQKKSLFLSEVKDALTLDNLSVARCRFEEFDWSGFDIITSRALDRAEVVWPGALEKLKERQRLLLYSSPDLVSKLEVGLPRALRIETHPLPLTDNRVITILSVKTIKGSQ